MRKPQVCIILLAVAFLICDLILFLLSDRILRPTERRFHASWRPSANAAFQEIVGLPEDTNASSLDYFVTLASMIDTSSEKFRFTAHSAYSGMYWINREQFLNVNARRIHYLEEASHLPMQLVGNENVLLTKDWLDMAVEHLSRFHRTIHVADREASGYFFEGLVCLHTGFLSRLQKPWKVSNSIMPQTLALVPVHVSAASFDDMANVSVNLDRCRALDRLSRSQMENVLASLALTSTIASLWQADIGRVVIVGNSNKSPWLVDTAMKLLDHLSRALGVSLEVTYVCAYSHSSFRSSNDTRVNMLLVPADAIGQLQQAFMGGMPQARQYQWLGEDSNKWKYVYFTEPDLILHTRPSAIPLLSKQVSRGKLLTAHRFQPLPHVLMFPNNPIQRKVVPQLKPMIDLHRSLDSCCDQGNGWPGLTDYPKCNTQWHDCGLSNRRANLSMADLRRENVRLLPYPMMRLMDGTQSYVVSSHGRMCEPRRIGGCR